MGKMNLRIPMTDIKIHWHEICERNARRRHASRFTRRFWKSHQLGWQHKQKPSVNTSRSTTLLKHSTQHTEPQPNTIIFLPPLNQYDDLPGLALVEEGQNRDPPTTRETSTPVSARRAL